MYVDRIKNTGVVFGTSNVHNITAVALVLAIKFLEDSPYSDAYYADIIGISKANFIQYQTTVLKTLSYKLYVDEAQYLQYVGCLTTPPKKRKRPK
jgi:hypothetical protein